MEPLGTSSKMYYPRPIAPNLAFEFNGVHHFFSSKFYGESAILAKRDLQKSRECQKEGITLVMIPYWWNKTIESLQSIIYNVRPDLLSKMYLSIWFFVNCRKEKIISYLLIPIYRNTK